MKKYVLTVTLNPALDKTYIINNFRLNISNFFDKEILSAGGKGVNVSRALNSFKIKNFATGLLGKSNYKIFNNFLKKEKIKNNFVLTPCRIRENITLINTRTNKKTRILGAGEKVEEKYLFDFIKKYNKYLKKTCMVVLSGRVSYKAPDNFYSKLINIAKKMKVPVLVDTSGKPLIEALKAKPLIVKPNIHEAQEIFNCRIKTIKQIKKIVLKLHGFGIKIVLLTIGEKGAILSDGNKILKALAPKIKDINDVGSGDCFIAGFLYSFLKNEPMEKCLKMAVSAGSINALSAMPGSIKFKKVFELSKKIKILNI